MKISAAPGIDPGGAGAADPAAPLIGMDRRIHGEVIFSRALGKRMKKPGAPCGRGAMTENG